MENRGAAGSARLNRECGSVVMIPTLRGCKPPGAGERPVNGFRGRAGGAGKRQAGSFDPAMVAWRQAVVAGERKVVATGELRPDPLADGPASNDPAQPKGGARERTGSRPAVLVAASGVGHAGGGAQKYTGGWQC